MFVFHYKKITTEANSLYDQSHVDITTLATNVDSTSAASTNLEEEARNTTIAAEAVRAGVQAIQQDLNNMEALSYDPDAMEQQAGQFIAQAAVLQEQVGDWFGVWYIGNRPVTQIPQCTRPISHSAHFVHISVTKWGIVWYLSNAFWCVCPVSRIAHWYSTPSKTSLSHPVGIHGVTLCFCTVSSGAADRRVLFTR